MTKQPLALTASLSLALFGGLAREELLLAQERYRVGAATFLDLSDARASYARAESERINAAYEYHRAFAALESAVGRPLR